MRVELSGPVRGRDVTVAWEDGVLSGDPFAVDEVAFYAMVYAARRLRLGDLGHVSEGNHLKSPWGFVAVAQVVFDRQPTRAGDPMPDVAPIPSDAIP